MSDVNKGEERTTAIPLIVGVLAALTVGYWVFSGGKGEHSSNASAPAVGTHK